MKKYLTTVLLLVVLLISGCGRGKAGENPSAFTDKYSYETAYNELTVNISSLMVMSNYIMVINYGLWASTGDESFPNYYYFMRYYSSSKDDPEYQSFYKRRWKHIQKVLAMDGDEAKFNEELERYGSFEAKGTEKLNKIILQLNEMELKERKNHPETMDFLTEYFNRAKEGYDTALNPSGSIEEYEGKMEFFMEEYKRYENLVPLKK